MARASLTPESLAKLEAEMDDSRMDKALRTLQNAPPPPKTVKPAGSKPSAVTSSGAANRGKRQRRGKHNELNRPSNGRR